MFVFNFWQKSPSGFRGRSTMLLQFSVPQFSLLSFSTARHRLFKHPIVVTGFSVSPLLVTLIIVPMGRVFKPLARADDRDLRAAFSKHSAFVLRKLRCREGSLHPSTLPRTALCSEPANKTAQDRLGRGGVGVAANPRLSKLESTTYYAFCFCTKELKPLVKADDGDVRAAFSKHSAFAIGKVRKLKSISTKSLCASAPTSRLVFSSMRSFKETLGSCLAAMGFLRALN
nr:hypothetical protein Iba_chr03aCG5360 [Ipomoea batatas]